MIITNNNIGSQSNQKTVEFELDNSGGHLFSVLSQLYSKPVDSTIRELSTNCGDAHIMSNNTDRPFIIRLPNFSKDILTICFRDFGPGLSHEEVLGIYRIYGKSTKTKTNAVTGCLGLGSKSPYSISSTFYVKSYKNGKCSQYTCSMDNNSIPNITEVPIITDTYNENGLEVIIPFYKEVDFKKILPDVLKYFKVKPLVYMQQGDLEQDTPVDIKWHEIKDIRFLTKTIAINEKIKSLANLISDRYNNIPNEVIQLQIYYPLDKSLIQDTIKRYNKLYTDENNEVVEKFHIDKDTEKIIGFLLTVGIQLHAEPGKIAFAPSRETIKYTDLTLIYIIKELAKAARLFKKVFIKALSKLDSYEKIFKYIYLESNQYKLLADTFDISKLKNITIFSEIFKRKVEPKLILGKISGNELKNPLNEYKIYFDSIEKMDLYQFKSMFGSCFRSEGNQRYLNIFDPTIRRVDNANISTAMVINGATPFLNSLIEATTKKIYILAVNALYKEVLNMIEKLFSLSDIDFMMYRDEINVFKLFDVNHEDYKTSEKEVKQRLKQEMIEKYNSWTYYDLYKIVNGIKYINSKTAFGRITILLNNIHTEIFDWPFHSTSRNLEYALEHLPELKKANMHNIMDIYTLYDLGKIKYKDIIFKSGITFQKMYRQQQNAKNKFWTTINNLPFNFDNVIEDFINFRVKEIEKLPLDGLAGMKKGDVASTDTFIANVAIWIFYKYYRNEVEIQNNYHTKTDIKNLLVNELVNFNILPEYLTNLKPARKLLVQRNSTSKFSFNKVDAGEITNSNIWYHNELNEINLADIHNEINNYIIKITHSLKCMVKINRDSFKWVANASIGNNLNASNYKNSYFGNSPHMLNEYISRLKYIANNMILDITPTIANWNNAVTTLNGLVSLDKDICSNDLEYIGDMRPLYENSENLLKNKDNKSTIKSNDTDYILIQLEDNKIIVSRQKEKFILLDTTSFRIPVELRDEFQNKLFSENKVCILNPNLKSNIGINPFPELIDFKEVQSTCTDAKMRKHKNRLYEDISFNDLENVLKIRFPDYIFLKYIDNFPTKLIKNAYNPLPLIIKMMSDQKVNDELMNLSFCYNNQAFNQLPVSGFFRPTEATKYNTNLVDFFRNEETKDYFRNNSTSHISGAMMLALGKKNQVSFKNFEKLLTTFGNEDLLKEYHFLRDFTYYRFKSCMRTVAQFQGFDDFENITIDSFFKHFKDKTISSLKLGNIFDVTNLDINKTLKFYRTLKTFIEQYVNGVKSFNGKIFDMNAENHYEIEFRKMMKTRQPFITLIENVNKYCIGLNGRGTLNLENIKEDFNEYLKPTKTCQRDIIKFRDQDEFFEKLQKLKRTEILNKKINRRTENKKRNFDAKWNGGKL